MPGAKSVKQKSCQHYTTLARLDKLQQDIDDAPTWKEGTAWWNERQAEIDALSVGMVAIDLCKEDGTYYRRVFLDQTLWACLEIMAAGEGLEVGELFVLALKQHFGAKREGGAR